MSENTNPDELRFIKGRTSDQSHPVLHQVEVQVPLLDHTAWTVRAKYWFAGRMHIVEFKVDDPSRIDLELDVRLISDFVKRYPKSAHLLAD
jgi:hypothetical protein